MIEAEVRNEKPARYRQLFRLPQVPPAVVSGRRVDARGVRLPHRRSPEPLQRHQQVRPPDGQLPPRPPALRRFPPRRGTEVGTQARHPDLPPRPPRTGWSRITPTPGPTSLRNSPPSSSGSARSPPAGTSPRPPTSSNSAAKGVWVPDYKFVHRKTGVDVHVEVLGFWKRVQPRPAPPPPPRARSAPLPPGDLREAQGRRGGPRRTRRPGPPLQGNPQRLRTRPGSSTASSETTDPDSPSPERASLRIGAIRAVGSEINSLVFNRD